MSLTEQSHSAATDRSGLDICHGKAIVKWAPKAPQGSSLLQGWALIGGGRTSNPEVARAHAVNIHEAMIAQAGNAKPSSTKEAA